jgi:hypothetical protein
LDWFYSKTKATEFLEFFFLFKYMHKMGPPVNELHENMPAKDLEEKISLLRRRRRRIIRRPPSGGSR